MVKNNYKTITAHHTALMTLPSDTPELRNIKENVSATYYAYADLFDFVTKINSEYADFTLTFNANDTALTQALAELQAVAK